MFNVGDKVRIRSNGAAATVVYAEDGYYSVELTTGTEMDFENPDLLMSEDEYQAQQEASRPVPVDTAVALASFANAPYVPQKGDRKVAATVIVMVGKIYPGFLDAVRVKSDDFDKLDAFDQVKALSEITGTPMIMFMGAGQMGDEGMMRAVLSKTMLNNLVDGTDLVSDMLLGTARRMIAEYKGK